MEDRSFSVRRFKSSDVDGIIELLNTVFEPKFTLEWWKWKYQLNPNGFWGEKGDTWVAVAEDKIVGYYAIIPERIKYHSKVMKIAQSVDTATHPDYRRMGIFTTLANNVYSDARNRYSFIFGFPSEMAHNGFLRLGWRDFFSTSEYIKISDYDKFCKRKIANSLIRWSGKLSLKMLSNLSRISKTFSLGEVKGSNIEVQEIEKFSEEINVFWELARTNYKIILERTDTFLNWRFSKHFGRYQIYVGRSIPKNDIVGYIVLRKRDSTLDIIDLVTSPNEDRAMLQLVDATIGKYEEVDLVRCWFPKWNQNAVLLHKLGFIPTNYFPRLKREYITPFILYNLTSGGIADMKDWFYTLADTDFE